MAAPTAARRRIDVVAAVLLQPDGRFLLAQRPAGKAYAGYWEFPGGKVEAGETPAAALSRELHEELGITITAPCPWLIREFDYPHADVRLHFFRVYHWQGELHGREGQACTWQGLDALTVAPVLPANGPIFAALALPEIYGITGFAATEADAALLRIDAALVQGLRLIQVRAKDWPAGERAAFAHGVVVRAHAHGAKVLINGDAALAAEAGADGVHLTSVQLHAAAVRPALPLVAASCHTAADLVRAHVLGLDFAVLGPVAATPTHPGAALLGWAGFRALALNTRIPLYALGGMQPADLETARAGGAHGLAMVRGAWFPG